MDKKSDESGGCIIITGPESCGKTAIAEHLSKVFNGIWVPEFARGYVENLNRPYTYNDIEIIAKQQLKEYKESLIKEPRLRIFDTGLIITKVWFDVVYKKHPQWLVDAIDSQQVDLYLLCNTNLPWKPDKVRENGGAMREELFQRYKQELEHFKLNYKIVGGTGPQRFNQATAYVRELYNFD